MKPHDRRMCAWRRACALTALAGLTTLPAAATPPTAACRLAVNLPALTREELVAAPLTSDVFLRTRDDLADLRLLDDTDQPAPFIVETLATRETLTRRIPRPMSPPQARELENQTLELTFEVTATNSPSPNGCTVDTPLRDFRQRVRVEGCASNDVWRTLADGATLYDLSRFVDVRQCDVAWAAAPCTRFRLTFFDAARDRPDAAREVTSGDAGESTRQVVRHETFRVNAVRFWHTETFPGAEAPTLTPYPLPADTAASRHDKGLFVLRGQREPLTRIALTTPERIFQRSYRLYGRNNAGEATLVEPGHLLAVGTLTQIRFQEISHRAMTIAFPPSRFREYIVVCETTGGGAPPKLDVERAEGLCQRLLFIAAPGRRYALLCGGDVFPPLAEAAALRTLLAEGCHPLAATLAAAGDGAPPPAAGWLAWLNSSTAMIGAIVIVGLLLTLLLVQAARKAR